MPPTPSSACWPLLTTTGAAPFGSVPVATNRQSVRTSRLRLAGLLTASTGAPSDVNTDWLTAMVPSTERSPEPPVERLRAAPRLPVATQFSRRTETGLEVKRIGVR